MVRAARVTRPVLRRRGNAPIPPIPSLSAGCNVPPFPRVEPTGRRHVFRVNPPRGTSWSRIPAAPKWSSRHSRSRGVHFCLCEINVVSRTTEGWERATFAYIGKRELRAHLGRDNESRTSHKRISKQRKERKQRTDFAQSFSKSFKFT